MRRTLEPPISTLIVDDQPDIRLLLRVIINASNNGLVVAGEAESGSDALELVETLDPDVIVLDQMMPGMTGLEVAEQIMRRRPEQVIVLCTAFLNDELRAKAAELGIAGCIPKSDARLVPMRLMQAVVELRAS